MADVAYRGFEPGDAGKLIELVASGMPADPVSLEWFTENVLLDANFDAAGLIVADGGDPAWGASGLLGFVYAVRGRGTPGIPVDPEGGWITIGTVHPDARRQGIGGELVERAKAFLSSRGARWVNFSGYPPAYFLPGLDADVYPDGLRLLERHGFQTRSRPVAMDINLAAYATPDDVLRREAARAAEGYVVGPARADDLPEVIEFAATEMAPDWGEAVRQAVLRHARPDRVLLVRDPDGRVIGFATYGAYRGLRERFGPIGVVSQRRGLGLGKILMHASLRQMRAEGVHGAWFLWTGAEGPAARLYLEAGFTITRTFHVMLAELDSPEPARHGD